MLKGHRRAVFFALLAATVYVIPAAVPYKEWVAFVLFIVSLVFWTTEGLG